MDTEERNVYPITPEQAIYRCREQIRGLVFPTEPAKKIKTRGILPTMQTHHLLGQFRCKPNTPHAKVPPTHQAT